jgi:hypothetical protein
MEGGCEGCSGELIGGAIDGVRGAAGGRAALGGSEVRRAVGAREGAGGALEGVA